MNWLLLITLLIVGCGKEVTLPEITTPIPVATVSPVPAPIEVVVPDVTPTPTEAVVVVADPTPTTTPVPVCVKDGTSIASYTGFSFAVNYDSQIDCQAGSWVPSSDILSAAYAFCNNYWQASGNAFSMQGCTIGTVSLNSNVLTYQFTVSLHRAGSNASYSSPPPYYSVVLQ